MMWNERRTAPTLRGDITVGGAEAGVAPPPLSGRKPPPFDDARRAAMVRTRLAVPCSDHDALAVLRAGARVV